MKHKDIKTLINDRLDEYKESNLLSYEARRVLSEVIASDVGDLLKSEADISVERPAEFLIHGTAHLHDGVGQRHCGGDCDGSCLD